MDEVLKLLKEKLSEEYIREYCYRCGYSDRELDVLEYVLASTDQEPFSAEEISDRFVHEICMSMIPIMEELKKAYKPEKVLA